MKSRKKRTHSGLIHNIGSVCLEVAKPATVSRALIEESEYVRIIMPEFSDPRPYPDRFYIVISPEPYGYGLFAQGIWEEGQDSDTIVASKDLLKNFKEGDTMYFWGYLPMENGPSIRFPGPSYLMVK